MRMFFGRFNVKIQFQVSPKTGQIDFLTTRTDKNIARHGAKAQRFKALAELQRKRMITSQGPLSLVAFCSFVVKKINRKGRKDSKRKFLAKT